MKVIALAGYRGWRFYHAPDNRPGRNGGVQRVVRGWPDLVLVRDDRMIVAELKAEKGRLRPGQQEWLDALAQVPGVEAHVWRPSDWPAVEAALL